MANKAFPTIPGTINIPSGVEDFKTAIQVVWTASAWQESTSNITITHGPSAGQIWGGDESFEIRRQENMYQPQQTLVLEYLLMLLLNAQPFFAWMDKAVGCLLQFLTV